ncbi:MAG: hypothetical protein A2096_09465 [Spirochaetes bacterium GWF1_41_5]|nr:MAG: hypothetical protein A2096_09465 [Spirochaetes bacterium GWF1_41_5]HBE03661.1 CopG family transcriptional regulator [Spirochaetia bacterium]
MLTVRLPSNLELKIKQISQKDHISKSDIVKEAISEYIQKHGSNISSFKLGEDNFGKYSSGNSNLSLNYKNILKQKLNEKYSH